MNTFTSAARLGALMALNYALIAVSFRMLARGSYVGVAIADAAIAWFGFTLVRYIGKADSLTEKVGYTIGAIVGSLVGMWVTR